jgi:Sulfotransferase family
VSIAGLSSHPAAAAKDTRAGPVIVLAYAGSGAGRLRSLLSTYPELVCTAGTGIVPLCDQAMAAWQAVDRRAGGKFSQLALASVRSFSDGLITAILAREGGRRWCELISAPPAATGTFARLYPQARFLTVHREASAVVRAILDENRWGLSGPEYAPFVSAHPASTAAALASYWAARTTQQLEFEQAHHGSCLPVRIEDLSADAAQAMHDIAGFLSADLPAGPPSLSQEDPSGPAALEPPAAGFPLNQITAASLAQLNELHRKLGYPPLTSAEP